MRKCSIDGCEKPSDSRDWCQNHYNRWRRYGDPLAGRSFKGDAAKFLEWALTYSNEDCLIWQFIRDKNGYAQIYWPGRGCISAHRLMCERVWGPPPTKTHLALHSCGNGHLGCVNPHHVRWGTPAENAADRIRHGRSPRGARHARAKLTEKQVLEVRSLKGVLFQRELAQRYGVSRGLIAKIHCGEVWKWLQPLAPGAS